MRRGPAHTEDREASYQVPLGISNLLPNVRWSWQGRYGGGGYAAASYWMPLQLNFRR